MDLKSSISQEEIVTEIVHFSSGQKKTFRDIIVKSIEEATFTRFILKDGRKIYINPKNVDFFEVFK